MKKFPLIIAVLFTIITGLIIFLVINSPTLETEDVIEISQNPIFSRPAPKLVENPKEIDPGEWNWELKSFSGKSTVLSNYKGKIIFFNWWATWCKPCINEMASIHKLIKETKGLNIEFFLVTDEDEATVEPFVKDKKWDLPIYYAHGEVPPSFTPSFFPTTYIFNSKGDMIINHTGMENWSHQDVITFLTNLSK